MKSSINEVQLSTGMGILFVTQGFRTDLPGQIYLQAGIDGNHIIVFADDMGIIYEIDGIKLHTGIIIDPVIQLAGSHGKSKDGTVGHEGFTPISYNSGFP